MVIRTSFYENNIYENVLYEAMFYVTVAYYTAEKDSYKTSFNTNREMETS